MAGRHSDVTGGSLTITQVTACVPWLVNQEVAGSDCTLLVNWETKHRPHWKDKGQSPEGTAGNDTRGGALMWPHLCRSWNGRW